ncbi:major facilitator superfamily protein permease [Anaeromyces robustus]|uniref:Major facilitator superfamily protein permease n=1 Tax=Anaeromyces robustus TaxID=1754192 RepID=A0A1Y1WZK6_9FUNG|nr:major facilitator superfamily protein permease [Anaeromyces robustus]|eukprot:ORX78981.1 major facilitator superfamily protein permease [Anaeromyces robustus]
MSYNNTGTEVEDKENNKMVEEKVIDIKEKEQNELTEEEEQEKKEEEEEEIAKNIYKKFTSKKRLQMFINVNLGCIAGTMLHTALATALPPIIKDFKISVNLAQWLTSGFSLTMAIIIPLSSFLMNRFRTRRLYLTAIILFLSGVTLALCSINFYMILFGRIIQGFGSGLLSSMGQVVVLTIYPPEKRGSAMGWYGLSLNAAPVIAPAISGVLSDYISWRMIFVLALVIMIINLIYTLMVFIDCLPNKKVHFDIISFLLSILAFGGITLAAGNFGSYKFVSVHVLLALIIGIISCIIFAIRQLNLKQPFIDIRVLKHKTYAVAAITIIGINLINLGSAVILPLYFQQVKGKTATISGLAVLPGSLALALISPYAGKIYDKIGIKSLYIFAGIFSTLSNLILYFININFNIWFVSAINIIRSICISILNMPVITWGMSKIPASKTTDGSATINSFRIVSGAIGTALFVSIMTFVSDKVKTTKPYPDLYGVNIVFLVMAIISFIILLLGIFGCHDPLIIKKKSNNQIENEK